jgi:hypothetical protein
MDQWMVFCCGQRYTEEIAKASDDQLSNWKAIEQVSATSILLDNNQLSWMINQALAMEYSLGPEIVAHPYHIDVIRTALNHNLAACYPIIQEEVAQSFEGVLALDGNGENHLATSSSHLVLRYVQNGRLYQP